MSRGYATKRPPVAPNPGEDRNKYVNRSKSSKRKTKINLRAVAEVLAARGYDPTEELIDIIETGSLPPEVESRTWLTLLEYTQPKKKAVEITGKDGGPIKLESVSDADLLKIAMGAAAREAQDIEYVEVDDRPRNAFGQLISQPQVAQAIAEDDEGEGDDLPEALQ